MEVKIGIQSAPRELVVETRSSAEDVQRSLMEAVASGSLFVLSDDRGGKIMVPGDKIGYVEMVGNDSRRVGFGNI